MSALRTSYSHLTLGASRLLCGTLYRVFRLAYKIRECNEEFYSVAWHSKNFNIVIPLDTINVINLVLHIYDIHLAVPLHTSFSNHDHFLKSNRHGFKKLQMFKVVFFGSLYL